MKYLFQFLIIIAFSLIGEVLNRLIPLPIPASIYGIILLFIALELKWIKVRQIKDVSDFLLTIMPILFLPPAVGILASWGNIKACWIPYLVITFATTFIVMGVAGAVTQAILRKRNHRAAPTEAKRG